MRVRLLGGLGALLTVGTVAVVVSPDLANAASGAVAAVEPSDPERLLLMLGSLVGAYAAWAARSGSSERQPEEGPDATFAGVGDPPEAASAHDRARTGEPFDRRVTAACEGDDEALESVRETLAETAASAHARARDRSAEQARRAVASGEWTDDPLAAAFLAGAGDSDTGVDVPDMYLDGSDTGKSFLWADADGPGFPVWARIRAWLDPETERRRRVERTVAAVRTAHDAGNDRPAGGVRT